jgi:uncharacterized protein YcsI (UPF0317 family)
MSHESVLQSMSTSHALSSAGTPSAGTPGVAVTSQALSSAGTPGVAVRLAARNGLLTSHTSGLAPGIAQANIVILPSRYASSFREFCFANAQACPLLEESPLPGDPTFPQMCAISSCDVSRDVPAYLIWNNGISTLAKHGEVADLWALHSKMGHIEERLVAFALGCSFSFENALIQAGIPLAHISAQKNVSMYTTNIPTIDVSPFFGSKVVVSMRPMTREHSLIATRVCESFPRVHGVPIHIGDTSFLGISDIYKPDFGDPPLPMREDEICVFWACGVTPQIALIEAKLPFAITHAPGCMLVLDVTNEELRGEARR